MKMYRWQTILFNVTHAIHKNCTLPLRSIFTAPSQVDALKEYYEENHGRGQQKLRFFCRKMYFLFNLRLVL